MERRNFLKVLATGVSGMAFGNVIRPKSLNAKETGEGGDKEFLGVLVDTTRCIGCRNCEMACAEANNMPLPDLDDETIFDEKRLTSETSYTVVNRYKTEDEEIFVKTQCMHCNQPGCVSACLVSAMHKTEEGPVIWETNCIGCRYCMVACPFDIPKFEYNSPVPKIQKCTFCWENAVKKGGIPACVEACPSEALVFGTRRELIEEANKRIYRKPEAYYHHIYGEHEVGGTSWLYLSAVPFEQIGFRTDLGTTPYPKLTKGFLTNIAVIDLVVPALLLGINYAVKKKKDD